MKNKALLLVTLLVASGSVLAESDLLGNAGKQLLKDTATSAAPKEAVQSTEAASKALEDANKLKETVKSPTDALKGQAQDIATESAKQTMKEAQDIATESAKQKAKEAVPEKAKESIKTVEKGSKTAKKLKGSLPKSTGEATKAIKSKAQEEATKKALDTLK